MRQGAESVFVGPRHMAFNHLKAETRFKKGMPAKQCVVKITLKWF